MSFNKRPRRRKKNNEKLRRRGGGRDAASLNSLRGRRGHLCSTMCVKFQVVQRPTRRVSSSESGCGEDDRRLGAQRNEGDDDDDARGSAACMMGARGRDSGKEKEKYYSGVRRRNPSEATRGRETQHGTHPMNAEQKLSPSFGHLSSPSLA